MKQLLHRDLIGIAASMTLSHFGASLVNVFVPLLLLQKGLALWHICVFYVVYAVFKLVMNYPAMVLASKKGVRTGLTIGYTSNALFLVVLTLYLGGWLDWGLYILPVLMAADHAFTWGTQHWHVSRVMDVQRTGRDFAVMQALGQGAGIVAPLIGGFIAIKLGQAWLAGIAAFFVLLSVLPVRQATRLQEDVGNEKVNYTLRGAPARDLIANFAFNVHANVGVLVWPIYLAVMLTNFRSIGLITTISGAVAFILLFAAGRRGDKGKNRAVLIESTALSSIGHLSRALAHTPVGIAIVSAFYNTALAYQAIPWGALYYRHSRVGGINYIMSMEIACDLAFVTMWSVFALVAYFYSTATLFNVAFIGAAAIAWACLLIRQDAHLIKEHPPAGPADASVEL